MRCPLYLVCAVVLVGTTASAEESPAPTPVPAPAPTAPNPSGAAVDPGAAEAADYNARLREIEARVNELKERIFQSKARLVQLQEVVLRGNVAGAKLVLVHRNEVGGSFRLVRAQYVLDGAPVFNRAESGEGELDAKSELPIYAGSIAPGNHQLAVFLEYQGHGYGAFSYLTAYRFKVKSSYTFGAEEDKLTTIRVVGYEKGGFTTELKDRLAVRFDVEAPRQLERPPAPPQAARPAPAAPPLATKQPTP